VSADICWHCSALDFECDQHHLVYDSLINRQPVQAVQQRLGAGSSWHTEVCKKIEDWTVRIMFKQLLLQHT